MDGAIRYYIMLTIVAGVRTTGLQYIHILVCDPLLQPIVERRYANEHNGRM